MVVLVETTRAHQEAVMALAAEARLDLPRPPSECWETFVLCMHSRDFQAMIDAQDAYLFSGLYAELFAWPSTLLWPSPDVQDAYGDKYAMPSIYRWFEIVVDDRFESPKMVERSDTYGHPVSPFLTRLRTMALGVSDTERLVHSGPRNTTRQAELAP